MHKGKCICNVLKAIRKRIATTNGIEYSPAECSHEGDCRGTCPVCEAEVRYLERQITMRRLAGKAVAVAGLAAGMAALTACGGHNDVTEAENSITKNIGDSDLFGIVETMPQFPGGQAALMKYLEENLRVNVTDDRVNGKVVVSFTVMDNGSIKNVRVMRGVGSPELEKEAVRVVRAMPKWIPGKHGGKNVPVKYTLPVLFNIRSK